MIRTPAPAAVLAAAALLGCASAPPRLTQERGPDGLVRVEQNQFHEAWASPDLDWAQYTKVMLADVSCQFRGGEGESGVDPETRAAESSRLSAILGESLRRAIDESDRFQIALQPGPDVLVLRPALRDVVAQTCSGMTADLRFYQNRTGQATLELEVRDSLSDRLVARCADRKGAQRTDRALSVGDPRRDYPEVEEVARMWARRAREHLEGLAELPLPTSDPVSSGPR